MKGVGWKGGYGLKYYLAVKCPGTRGKRVKLGADAVIFLVNDKPSLSFNMKVKMKILISKMPWVNSWIGTSVSCERGFALTCLLCRAMFGAHISPNLSRVGLG